LRKGEDVFFKNTSTYVGTILRDGEYQYLKITKINGVELPQPKIIPVNLFIGIDPASSTADNACFSVTFSIAYSFSGDLYVLPYFRKRVSPMVHAEQIIEAIKQNRYNYGSVETVNYQLILRDYLIQRLREESLFLRGLDRKWTPHENKDERLETMEPMFSSGHVYLQEDMSELQDEMEMFPSGTKDLLDGMYYATRKLIKPYHQLEDNKEPVESFTPRRLRVGEAINNNNWMLN
jgi:predicted phage terminase large subunit-like protein